MKKIWLSHCPLLLLWCLALVYHPAASHGTEEPCLTEGWFGTNCQYKCHCTSDNCDRTTGECLNNSDCVQLQFGPACQYGDFTRADGAKYRQPQWLYDGDDMTCNEDLHIQNVTVQLKVPFPFTWLRLHVNDTDALNTIEVYFKNSSDSDNENIVDCNNKRTAMVGDNSLDIHCDLDIYVQEVILSGEGVRFLCSVYISAGRFVTLRQSTTQTSTFPGYDSSRAVTNAEECSRTEQSKDPQWNVTSEQPQAINILVVGPDENYNENFTHMVRWYDKDSSPLLQMTRTTNDINTKKIYFINTTEAVSPITTISITATGENVSLGLCGVMAFGDTVCPQGKYGRECEHSCDNCKNQVCFVSTGGCPDGCIDGYLGGQCQTPCPATRFGKDCTQTCSVNCKDQLCNNTNGRCYQCVQGKAGDKCDQDFDFQMRETSPFNRQLQCSVDANNSTLDILTIIDLTISDVTKNETVIKLAALSVFDTDLYVDHVRKSFLAVQGSISQHDADLVVTFTNQTYCLLCSYMCELNCINSAGHPVVRHSTVRSTAGSDVAYTDVCVSEANPMMSAVERLTNITLDVEDRLTRIEAVNEETKMALARLEEKLDNITGMSVT